MFAQPIAPASESTRRYRWLLLVLVLCSFCFAVYTILDRNPPPRMGLGRWGADHISHQYATVVFAYRGLAIYQHSMEELLPRANEAQTLAFAEANDVPPSDVFLLPEWSKPQPLVFLNWPQLARVYPPGLYVYTLPEALALHWTAWPPTVLNSLTLLKYALLAHLALWLLFAPLLDALAVERAAGEGPGMMLLGVMFVVVQTQMCIWTLSGFYDGAALLFLFLALLRYREQRWVEVLFCFAVAVILHYRSLWYFPVAGLAIWELNRSGWPQRRQLALLLLTCVLLLLAGIFLILAYPSMTQFPDRNPLRLRHWQDEIPWLFLTAALAVGGYLCYQREWLLLAAIGGACFFLLNTPQVQDWHSLFFLPLLLCSRKLDRFGLYTSFALYIGLSWFFSNVVPLDLKWLPIYYLDA